MDTYILDGFFDELEKIAALPSPKVMGKLLDRIGASSGKLGKAATPKGTRTTLSFKGGKMQRNVNPPPIPAHA